MMGTDHRITRVVELTPAGRGAVAVVLVTGPEAVRSVDACFHPASGKQIAEMPHNRILFGRWGSASGEELVVCRRAEDAVEVHCHGGVAAVRAVIDRLTECGCESIRWQDRLRESGDDPIRAEAQIALAEAPTARTAEILLDQFDGALTVAVGQVLDAVAGGDWESAAGVLDSLLVRGDLGLHLAKPWRVVLAGRPNVGKSSLMNALVGFQRAIVCDLPGTTRDVVTANTAIDGWPVQLADTAGLRETRDEIESEGVARASAAAGHADLLLFVDDETNEFTDPPQNARRTRRVLNKVDLHPQFQGTASNLFDIAVSAVTGQGIPQLIEAIGMALVPAPPSLGDAVPFTADQVERLTAARRATDKRDAAAVASSLSPLVRR
jgi:tRNA modification GTPase